MEWNQCLLMLGDAKVDEHGNVNITKDCSIMYLDKDGEDREINISSAICFLRGKAYEGLENRAQARQWYKAAVKADPLCYEALERLIENHMLTCEEELIMHMRTLIMLIKRGTKPPSTVDSPTTAETMEQDAPVEPLKNKQKKE